MNKTDAGRVTAAYMQPFYGFALRRCREPRDAEDLAQEICLRVFRALLVHDDIADIAAFVWRVARNTLINYYRRGQALYIGIDEAVGLPVTEDVAEDVIRRETEDRLHWEIAYLSEQQRKIVIAYYYQNQKQQEIAESLGVPLGTVKWHLFEAKKELKKGMEKMRAAGELKFHPIRFENMGSSGKTGTMGDTANFFRSALSQNIAYCVWKRARTVPEIADCLGVSPIYVASEAAFLTEYGFLIQKGERYLANLVIDEPTAEWNREMDRFYSRVSETFANALYDELVKGDLLRSKGLLVPEGDDNFTLWALIPYIAAMSGERQMNRWVSFEEAATIRPDGAMNIAYATAVRDGDATPPHFESQKQWVGPCWNGNASWVLWQIDSEWSDKRIRFDCYMNDSQRQLDLLTRMLDGETLPETEIAYLAEKGLIRQTENGPRLACVYIADRETKQALITAGDRIRQTYGAAFDEWKAPLLQFVMDHTPEQLKAAQAFSLQHVLRFDGRFLLYNMLELLKNGKLKLPTEEQKRSLITLIVPA